MNEQNIVTHFSKDHRGLFEDIRVEFSCKRGQHSHINQDNFFVLVDGDTKIYGLFDGHGVKGHLISAFAMGTMFDYIKNSKCFKDKNLYD